MTPQAISVSQFVAIINETLGFAYPSVTIEGEVSSFKVNQGKFVFFDLKDDKNTLSCFMMLHQLKLPLEDGMKIIATGVPKVSKFSKFSLTVRDYELAGEGQLRRAMELLKRKLEGEGLFDPSRKRALPRFPHRLGLITSGASAAYSDFIKILGARWGGLDIQLADVSVQGNSAPDQIVGALEYFNQTPHPVDVVVLIRGGGSLEDLMAFSTEPVARAVAASRTPIIVGVGHEIDFSLADFAADVRAATPTDAARLVVPDRREIATLVARLEHTTTAAVESTLSARALRLTRATNGLEAGLRKPRERVGAASAQMDRSHARLMAIIQNQRMRQESALALLPQAMARLSREQTTRITTLERLLKGYNPENVLRRGYAIVRAGDRVIQGPSGVKVGEDIMIQLAKGKLGAKVTVTDDTQAI